MNLGRVHMGRVGKFKRLIIGWVGKVERFHGEWIGEVSKRLYGMDLLI